MAVPVAPAAGEPIAEAWGDVVHDAVVAMDIQAGKVNMVGVSNTASPSPVVVFPRPFASAPVVLLSSSVASAQVGFSGGALSATQMTILARRIDGGTSGITMDASWIAYGPRA